jgi:hypothetical protein
VIRDRLDRLAAALFPGGEPQERVASLLPFLAAYPDLPGLLLDRLDTDTRAHQVLALA